MTILPFDQSQRQGQSQLSVNPTRRVPLSTRRVQAVITSGHLDSTRRVSPWTRRVLLLPSLTHF